MRSYLATAATARTIGPAIYQTLCRRRVARLGVQADGVFLTVLAIHGVQLAVSHRNGRVAVPERAMPQFLGPLFGPFCGERRCVDFEVALRPAPLLPLAGGAR